MPNKSSSKLKQKNNFNYFKVYDTLRTKNLLVIFRSVPHSLNRQLNKIDRANALKHERRLNKLTVNHNWMVCI